ncbi:MAG: aconitate hydratase [Spirochaetes bacterium]|nr:aconitate hydratase [Spirochaetota bacterium]
MKGTLTERLIRAHLVGGEIGRGGEIALRIDQTLTQDATGTMTYLEFESMGIPRVRTGLSVSYVDHNIIQTDFRNADDHRFLQSAAARFGAVFSPPGNGISHHVHRERFGRPGLTLLGSDSHTTTGGCIGMLAMGAGGLEVAMAMSGEPYRLLTPEVWGIRVTGTLPAWVSGKDLILELLRRFSAKGATGRVLEFFGPGVAALDLPARATIANMSVDMGATACVFPSDRVTRDWLGLNGRRDAWVELAAEDGARYDTVTEIDLGSLVPMVAFPSNPDNVKTAEELADVPVHQVVIGSSTNGDYRDLMIASLAVAGRMRHPEVSFEINPGSRQTLRAVTEMGGLAPLVEAGARIHEAGCLGCIGMGQAPATGTNSLRTFPRNYKGRSGTADDAVYLCSPETAAASALRGRITDPRTLGKCPQVPWPKRFAWRTEWFVQPPSDGSRVEIRRGPNIQPFPTFAALEDDLELEVLLVVGDNISTDRIMPAGNRVLPYRSNIPAISGFVFDQVDPEFPKRAKERGSGMVVGGENYGQGSSREHAAIAPRFLGVRVKLVKGFARIHKANLVNFGIVPLVFADPADWATLHQGDIVRFPGIRRAIIDGAAEIVAVTGGRRIRTRLDASARDRAILAAGGLLNLASHIQPVARASSPT